jgi:diguanylate cyclase (GGDEF)-like protein
LRSQDIIGIGPHVTLRFATLTDEELRLAQDLYDSSMRDPLTRAYNRRYLTSRVMGEAAYVVRHGGVMSLLTFDYDHFKRLNDTHGHAIGDAVLREGAALVRRTLRSEDVLARIGGEEFAIVLRGIGRAAAVKCAERVRAALQAGLVSLNGVYVDATVSIGVATSDEVEMDESGLNLMKLADDRLYAAKGAGRNRVVGAPPAATSDP